MTTDQFLWLQLSCGEFPNFESVARKAVVVAAARRKRRAGEDPGVEDEDVWVDSDGCISCRYQGCCYVS